MTAFCILSAPEPLFYMALVYDNTSYLREKAGHILCDCLVSVNKTYRTTKNLQCTGQISITKIAEIYSYNR